MIILLSYFALISYVTVFAKDDFRLQILHTNDIHAHFNEMDENCQSCLADDIRRGHCYGGVARMRQAAVDATAEARDRNISSIFVNAGDTFQGTPFYKLYKWQIYPFVNSLGFDVITLGNHEFDDGVDNLMNFLQNLNVSVVISNINFTTDNRLLNGTNVTPTKVITVADGVQIGIVGYLTPETVNTSCTENVEFLPEVSSIREHARKLRSQGVKIIIALGHSDLDTDIRIAKEVEEISVVVGGHTHSLFYSPKDKPPSTEKATEEYPLMVTQNSGKQVPVVQAYAYSKYIGKLLVTFNANGDVISAEGDTILLNSSIGKDPVVDNLVNEWAAKLDKSIHIVKGYTRVFISRTNFYDEIFESNAGNMITDAFIDAVVRKAKENNTYTNQWTTSSIALYINGGIRSKIDPKRNNGAITLEDLLSFLPFENKLYETEYSGQTLLDALEYSVVLYDKKKDANYLPYFLLSSGIKVVYNLDKPKGKRVEFVQILCANCSIPSYEPLDPVRRYSAILPEYLLDGKDGFVMMKKYNSSARNLEITDTDAVTSYIERRQIVYPELEGRIIVKGYRHKSTNSKSSTIVAPIFLIIILNLIIYVR